MTNRTAERPVRGHDGHAPTPVRPPGDGTRSLRAPSLAAGVGLLLMAALAGFGIFIAVEGLVTPGDPAATARDVLASEGVFRLGIASLVGVVVLDVVVAWGLFEVFAHVSAGLSRLAAWLRLVYAGVFLVAITELLGAVGILGGLDQLAGNADQLQVQALQRTAAFTDVWNAGLVLFGLHLLVVGYLAYRSADAPKLLGVLVGIAGMGYIVDSVAAVLGTPTSFAALTFVGEVVLALWLVIWGRRITVSEPPSRVDVAEVAR